MMKFANFSAAFGANVPKGGILLPFEGVLEGPQK